MTAAANAPPPKQEDRVVYIRQSVAVTAIGVINLMVGGLFAAGGCFPWPCSGCLKMPRLRTNSQMTVPPQARVSAK